MSRQAMLETLPLIMDEVKRRKAEEAGGQINLLGYTPLDELLPLPDIPDDPEQNLRWEKEYLGIYVSGHPTNPYEFLLGRHTEKISDIIRGEAHYDEGQYVVVLGSIEKVDAKHSKAGTAWAQIDFEDATGNLDVMCFREVFADNRELLVEGEILLIGGSLHEDRRMSAAPASEEAEGEPKRWKLFAKTIERAQEFCASWR